MNQVLSPTVETAASISRPNSGVLVRNAILLTQLALASLVVYLYQIEGPAFFRVFLLGVAGFAVNLVVPLRHRLKYFALLSLSGAFLVFGPVDAAWLIGAGAVLIALCHLPFSMRIRTVVLLAVAAVFAISRGGLLPSPWSAAVWPILGSMFMFRLVLYMMALKSGTADGTPWGALAYFFMLPNLVFPLFPVVDYQTFRRTHYDKAAFGIYEQGLLWIARGLVHLLLYRLVYHSVLNDPADVVRLSDLVQFMLGTFLLYLRVSGQFHLIVGILHLFGFRLPETHKLYYLAHSFTELWRRINIYWTDFMMKTVFYPTYFKVKKRGPVMALGISTVAVFITTWVLHSYQWFWLRGGFPLTLQDTLFWGILGALVVTGALKELKGTKKPRASSGGWNWQMGARAAATFTAFCFLWSLWSTQSVTDWVWMIGSAFNVDAKGLLLVAASVGTIFFLGARDWEAAQNLSPFVAFVRRPATRTVAPLAILLVLALPGVRERSPGLVVAGLDSLHTTGLNARDAALQHRGYYEQLDVRAQLNGQVLDALSSQRTNWQDLGSLGIIRERNDVMLRDLYPSRSLTWNGNSFSTNQWGMRDREYSREKPAGTFRIAMLGPSHVMGNGVSDGQTFEGLVEDRLNRELRLPGYNRIEILNFAVDGFALSQQVAMLEDRVLQFSPDVVIATHYHRNRAMTEGHVVKLATRGFEVPDPGLQRLLKKAGLADLALDGVPIPFTAGRALAGMLGIRARMPSGEVEARARWIADDVMAWSVIRFAEVTRQHGMTPAILGLNAVIDDVPRGVPYQTAIDTAGLPLFNLLDIYPESDRAALRVAPWDDHPNAAGHRYIAERFYPELADFLTRSRGAATMTSSHDQTNGGLRR